MVVELSGTRPLMEMSFTRYIKLRCAGCKIRRLVGPNILYIKGMHALSFVVLQWKPSWMVVCGQWAGTAFSRIMFLLSQLAGSGFGPCFALDSLLVLFQPPPPLTT